jgi:hypothetical protein
LVVVDADPQKDVLEDYEFQLMVVDCEHHSQVGKVQKRKVVYNMPV